MPLQTNSSLASAPEGPRRLSFGLTEADIVAAQSEYPQHDVEGLLPRFVAVNEQKDGGVAASKNPLKWLKGFLKHQKSKAGKQTAPNGTAVAAKAPRVLPKLTVKYSKKDQNFEDPHWKIGGKSFYDEHMDAMRAMPLQSKASAHEWLRELIGFEWDTEAALDVDSEFGLFLCYDNDMVEGVECYYAREAQKETKRVEKIIEQTEPPIEPPAPEPEPEPVVEIVEPEIVLHTEPQHGDVREDGRVYDDRRGLWLKKANWENLERTKQS